MVNFGSSLEIFNVQYLERRSSIDTKSNIFNKTYGFFPPYLDTSMQPQNLSSSTYTGETIMISIKSWNKRNNTQDIYKDSDAKQKNPMMRRKLLSNNFFCHQL